MDIATEAAGYLLFLLNTPLFKASTSKKAALLLAGHDPGSEGHGTVPTGAGSLLLAPAAGSTGPGGRLAGDRAVGYLQHQLRL